MNADPTPSAQPDPVPRALAAIRAYRIGGSRGALLASDDALSVAATDPSVRTRFEDGLLALLKESVSPAAQEHICRQLGLVGSDKSAPALARLLSDPALVTAASVALDALPGPGVDKALLDAFDKASGPARLASMDLLGRRRAPRSIPLLVKQARGNDAHASRAACAALGLVGTAAALDALRRLVPMKGEKPAPGFIDACLTGVERLGRAARPSQALLKALQGLELPRHEAEAVAARILAAQKHGAIG